MSLALGCWAMATRFDIRATYLFQSLVQTDHQLSKHNNITTICLSQTQIGSGFETQRKRHQKSKTGVSVAPQKRTFVPKKINLKKVNACYITICCGPSIAKKIHNHTLENIFFILNKRVPSPKRSPDTVKKRHAFKLR